MRIHSLSFRGVGPYRDEQRIDFDQLGESGLYLINGPTGAGKSTIIDCICYGLYGRLASDEADLSRMRSDFAGPKDTTEVDLVFETAAGVFRVIRTPEYLRAKAKGEGVTPSRTSCRLFRIRPDGSEETIATNVASADTELSRVIGLTRAQFVQTVVLPQGQFSTFLYSDTRQREEILKRIFNTQLYERVAEILKGDAKAAAEQKASATAEIHSQIRQLATSTGLDEATRDPLLELATNHLDEQLKAHLDELTPAFDLALATATSALEDAQTRATDADAVRDLARQEFDAQSAVATATAAIALATTGVDEARARLAATIDLAATIGIEVDGSTDVAAWRQRASAASSFAGELTGVLPEERAVIAWPTVEADAVQAITDLTASHEADSARLGDLPAAIGEQQAIANDRPTLEESTRLNERRGDVDEEQERFTALDAAQAQVPDLQKRAQSDHDTATRIDAELSSAGHAYRAGIAADLALQLEPGQPCAVCGATDHPSPALHTGTVVSFDDVESLRLRAGQAHIELAASAAALQGAHDRIAEITAEITMSRADLTTAQAELARSRVDLTRRSEDAERAAAAILDLHAERDGLNERAKKYTEVLATQQSALDTRREAMRMSAAKVAAARGDHPSVQERLDEVRRLETALAGLADRLADLDTARTSQALAEAALAGMAPRDGFGDVEAAQVAWKAADEGRLTADRACGEAVTRLEHLRAGTDAIATSCQERGVLIAQNADLIDLAELFSAGRGNEIGLHIYVLKSLFASVMDAANRRFESLLNGRYRLVPAPDSDGDLRKLQGLGVSVEDRLTGRVRPAKSLSGGETFCASLALALGLSDVVRMTAGGIDIGSLFIDEGFGSLDGDQLDEVMLMLGHLSSDGRRVGVISHVESLKTAITERIDVTAVGENRPTSLSVSWMT